MGKVNAWDDPDWFRDEREANPPDWIDARKVPRSEALDLFGLTEDGEPTPARKAWMAAESARLTREMESAFGRTPDYTYVVNVEHVLVEPSRFDLADGRVPDHDPDATVESEWNR